MVKLITLDEFHLTVKVPPTLTPAGCATVRKILNTKRFQADLRRAVRAIFGSYPALRQVRVTLSR